MPGLLTKTSLAKSREAYERFLRYEDMRIAKKIGPAAFAEIKHLRKLWPVETGYHNSVVSYYGRVQVEFGNHVPKLEAGSRVLDWGCSNGVTTIELANLHKGCEVIGIEIRGYLKGFIDHVMDRTRRDGFYLKRQMPPELRGSIDAVHKRMSLPKEFVIADGFNAPFRDGSFDAVYCMNSLYYVMDNLDDHRRFQRFHQVTRLVKPGGYLLFSGGGTIFLDGMSNLFAMVMRREGDEIVVKHVNRADWNARIKVEQVRQACASTFCSLD